MLGAMGILGALVAGLSLPFAFGRDDGDDDDEERSSNEADVRSGEEALDDDSPLSVALAEDGDDPGPEDAPLNGVVDDGGALLPDQGPEMVPEETDGAGPPGGQDLGGSTDSDVLVAGSGDDTLFGDFGDDFLDGGAGDDHLSDGAGDDTLRGGAGDDTLSSLPADGEAARDGQDLLDGGAGDDVLVMSDLDVATGGEGADVFAFGPGVAPLEETGGDDAPVIEDFDPDEDALVVVWDDYASDTPPELSLDADEEDPNVTRLLGNGKVLAVVHSDMGVSLDAVALRPASAIEVLGDVATG